MPYTLSDNCFWDHLTVLKMLFPRCLILSFVLAQMPWKTQKNTICIMKTKSGITTCSCLWNLFWKLNFWQPPFGGGSHHLFFKMTRFWFVRFWFFQIASLLIFLVLVFGCCNIIRVFTNFYEVCTWRICININLCLLKTFSEIKIWLKKIPFQIEQ